MAKSDKVTKVVTAAVIEALNKDSGGIVAEITADVLNAEDESYGYNSLFFPFAHGRGGKSETYLERLAREQVRAIVADAVKDWVNDRKEDLRLAVIEKLDADAIADSYINRLTAVMADASIDVRVDVSTPSSDGDDD